jgi:hypothetical protein
VRHARPQDLDRLEELLVQLRTLPGLVEKTRSVFYRKSRSFLHFHQDPKGLFADIGGGPNGVDQRIDVTDAAGRARLLAEARRRLAV